MGQTLALKQMSFRRLRKSVKIHKSSAHLSAYNGTPVKVVGKCILYVRHKGKSYPVLFHVAETNSTPILGLKTSLRLNLIKRVDALDNMLSPISWTLSTALVN